MSDPTSIFNGNQAPATPETQGGSNTPNVQTDAAITTMLAAIKNERGEQKYKSLDDALNALKHSQEYIPQLTQKVQQTESELAAARAQADRVAELERTLQALTQQKTETVTTVSPSLTEESVAKQVERILSVRQQQEFAKANLQTVVSTLQQTFGTDAEKVFYDKATELGMSQEDFNALAAKNPKAVLNLVGAVQKASTGAPKGSSLNTASFTPKTDSKIGRNTAGVPIGATFHELQAEWQNAKLMTEELDAAGLTINELTDPKNYFRIFKK